MRIMKRTIVYLIVVGLVLQGFGTKAFAANETDEIAKLNAVSGSGELLNETAGEALPSSIQMLSSDEMKTFTATEAGSSRLLNQMAGTDMNRGEGNKDLEALKSSREHSNVLFVILLTLIIGGAAVYAGAQSAQQR